MKKDFKEFNRVYMELLTWYAPKRAYALAVKEMKRKEYK